MALEQSSFEDRVFVDLWLCIEKSDLASPFFQGYEANFKKIQEYKQTLSTFVVKIILEISSVKTIKPTSSLVGISCIFFSNDSASIFLFKIFLEILKRDMCAEKNVLVAKCQRQKQFVIYWLNLFKGRKKPQNIVSPTSSAVLPLSIDEMDNF